MTRPIRSLALIAAFTLVGGPLLASPGPAATTVSGGVQRPRREGHTIHATWGRVREPRTLPAAATPAPCPPVWEWAAHALRGVAAPAR